MKKLNLILMMTIVLLTASVFKSHAQMLMIGAPESSDDSAIKLSGISTGSSVAVNQKAVKNFLKDYQLATGAEWYVLADKSLMCRFFINNILHRAFYTSRGHWLYTISGYDGSKLDKRIADEVKTVYFNSSIVYVNQVDLVNAKTYYVVEIRDGKYIRKIRVNDEDMEVVQEFERL
jgi:hypothetical protein